MLDCSALRRWALTCFVGIGICDLTCAQSPPAPTPAADDEVALGVLKQYCSSCHTGRNAEGGIRLDVFKSDMAVESNVELIEKVVRALADQQMPPADANQPSAMQRVALLQWVKDQLSRYDCGETIRPGRVTIRRLNRIEYDNTIRDLVGLDLGLGKNFPSDDVGNGFDNMGDVLSIPPILMEKYIAAAAEIAEKTYADPKLRVKALSFDPEEITKEPADPEAIIPRVRAGIDQFAMRAMRRPPTKEESDRLYALAQRAFESGLPMREVFTAVMTVTMASPHLIFRVESDDPRDFVKGVRPLNDFELATRLSYFLWSSMPDDALLDRARRGQLHTERDLIEEVDRMLADPKARALVDNFAGQWLQLRDIDKIAIDPQRFPTFTNDLRFAMRRETELLFESLIRENRSVLELLNADYTYVNETLAKHYGLEGVQGKEFQRVATSQGRRGVLTHASVLALTSNPTRTSPVKRGKWILDNLLGEPPPPPPPNVPTLEEGGETLGTLREQMEQHRADPNCAVCHTKMDTLGFGLENFDTIGAWREKDGRTVINAAGALPGGREFAGPVELVNILAEEKKTEFCRCMTQKLLTYALGRGMQPYDRCTLMSIQQKLADDQYRFHTLVKAIVTSVPFMQQELGR